MHRRQPVTLAGLPAALPHLSPAMRRIAREVLADPDAVADGLARELARRAGTSAATVSRFTRLLGHPTFTAFQCAVHRERTDAPPLA